jgi:hypothetical protein
MFQCLLEGSLPFMHACLYQRVIDDSIPSFAPSSSKPHDKDAKTFSRAKERIEKQMTAAKAWTFHDVRKTASTNMGDTFGPFALRHNNRRTA